MTTVTQEANKNRVRLKSLAFGFSMVTSSVGLGKPMFVQRDESTDLRLFVQSIRTSG
jgi:hypothetical protein